MWLHYCIRHVTTIIMVWNISKHEYINTYGYIENIEEISVRKNYSKFMKIFGKTPLNDKISKNTFVKVIL